MKHSEDLFNHSFRICKDIIVPEPKNDKSRFLQISCSILIVLTLFGMLPAIKLND